MNDEQLRRVFDARILPDLSADAQSNDGPVSIFLGGQPGAGKTRAQMLALGLHGGESILPIIGDDFRQYHPDFGRLMRDDPLRMPEVTAHAAGVWTGMAVEWADSHAASSIIEGTWRNPRTVLDEAWHAHELGRITHAVVVAVPPVLSRVAILARFYFDLESTGRARWTPPAAHDVTVANLPANVREIAFCGVFDRLTVIDRDGGVLVDGDDADVFVSAWRDGFTRTLTAGEHDFVVGITGRLEALAHELTPDNAGAFAVLDSIHADLGDSGAQSMDTLSFMPGLDDGAGRLR